MPEACLCADEDVYRVDCCDQDSIYNQGIGCIGMGCDEDIPVILNQMEFFDGTPMTFFDGEPMQYFEE